VGNRRSHSFAGRKPYTSPFHARCWVHGVILRTGAPNGLPLVIAERPAVRTVRTQQDTYIWQKPH